MPHNYGVSYTELSTVYTSANKAAFWAQYRDLSKLAYNESFREWYELLRTDINGVTIGQVAFGQRDFVNDIVQYPNGVKKLFTDDPNEQKELAGGTGHASPAWNKMPTQNLNIITHTFKIDYGKYIDRYAPEFEEFL